MALRGPASRVDPDALYERAVAALARRSRSGAELERWLLARATTPAAARAVLARLREHGYLDDRRFAESFAAYAKETEGFGAARVRRELRRRGVPAPLAETAVAGAFAGTREDQLLADFLRRKRLSRPETQRQAAALYRRLWQAGFSAGTIQAALRQWRVRAEWLDDLAAMEMEESLEEPPPRSEGDA